MNKRAVVVSLLLCVVAIACGKGKDNNEPRPTASAGAQPTPARTVNPGQHGPIASGDFAIEGAFDGAGKYEILYPFFDPKIDTCAEISGKDVKSYVVPLPSFVGQQRLSWIAGLREYRGPGTYDLSDLERVQLEVKKNADAKGTTYASSKSSTVKVTVDKDNKGTFEFTKLKSKSGGSVSGRASWSCQEGSKGKT